MKIVVLDGIVENPGDLSWDGFKEFGYLTVYGRTPEEKIIERIGDAEIVIANKVHLDAHTMESCPNIKYIGILATGYNNLDLPAAKKRGITVTNIPDYSTNDVAQMVFALLLDICHRVGHHSRVVHQGKWASAQDFCFWDFPLVEVAGKTLGIFGYGSIGAAVAKIALAFGMRVLVHTRTRKEEFTDPNIRYAQDLDAFLSQADIISMHTPLTPQTKHIINAKTIAKMKDGVIFINTARGPVVDEQALADALQSGKVYMAGLDVLETEPPQPDNPLILSERTVITPHIAWATKEARQRLMDIAVDNLASYLSGAPVNTV